MGIDWIILAFVIYVLAGSYTARQAYVIEQCEYQLTANDEETRGNRMDEIKDRLLNMSHGICNMNYSILKSRGCDCGKQRKWRKLHEELDALQDGGPVSTPPGPQWGIIPIWPVVAFHQFMTPDVSKMIVKGEVERVTEEWEAGKAGYTSDEYLKVLVNPWEHLTREDDNLSKEIKKQWADIKALAEAELNTARANGDEYAFTQEYADKVTVFNGGGTVRKSFNFDEEPILASADPKVITSQAPTTKTATPSKIVAGDKYWFEKSERISASDCEDCSIYGIEIDQLLDSAIIFREYCDKHKEIDKEYWH